MEKETFSNAEVADFMNENYVCIKVDREERPDVDLIYMNAVQIITRSGGWPLNCFALPDGRPVFGGTYFPTERWMDVLRSLQTTWLSDPERVVSVAEELTNGVSNTEIIKTSNTYNDISSETLRNYVTIWSKSFDIRFGANKGAPKFPMPGSLKFLLDFSWSFQNDEVSSHVKTTLERMMQGGIYDHLGGGFFRYSVDESWHVPHFEKMLYDNAQLISLYTLSFKHFGDERYRNVIYQTFDFIRRELRAPEGGFYSAIDADSEGEEGKFYSFTKREIDNYLGADAEIFSVVFGLSASGNHLGKNVLRIAASHNEAACVLGLDTEMVANKVNDSKTKLFNARVVRVRPITDDKQLTSWNAMTISALAQAYITFGDNVFLYEALSCIQFIENKLLIDDKSLKRVYCKGKSTIEAFLDDYAFLIEAYIDLYKATLNEEWLLKAKGLTEITISEFTDTESGMFFFTTENHDNLIVRKMELTDGVIASSNAVMANNLLELGIYFRNPQYTELAEQMLSNIEDQFLRSGPYVYRWAHTYLKHAFGHAELIAGTEKSIDVIKNISCKNLYPFIIPFYIKPSSCLPLTIGKPLNENEIKLCVGKICHSIRDEDEALKILNGIRNSHGTK